MGKWLAVAAFVALVTACNYGASAFSCDNDTQCGAGGTCELGHGHFCSFPDSACQSGRRFGDLAGGQSNQCVGQEIDAGIDAPPDAPPDAPQTCFGTGLVTVCLATAPTEPLPINAPTTINTTNSTLCVPTVSGGANYCVIAATTINITEKLRATGSKPLVLIARDSITTSGNGVIDVGSHRGQNPETGAGVAVADPAGCGAGTQPGNSGGGAGGSFLGLGGPGGQGGNGGNGGAPGAVVLVATVAELRSGCSGQDGNGTDRGARGRGGGAVFLISAGTISVGASILATGEGGDSGTTNTSGGGGAGAGGMIGFDATTTTVSGAGTFILASGGGGGEGSGESSNGDPGHEPITTAAAVGGNGQTNNGGNGGNGSSAALTGPGVTGNAGNNQAGNRGGGGGGGGGTGFIKTYGTANLGAQVSPPAIP